MPNCLVRFSLAAPPKRYCDFGQIKDALRDTFPDCTPLYVDYNKVGSYCWQGSGPLNRARPSQAMPQWAGVARG